MKHGSLFSGIGGFDLAAEWAGWENMFHCEWNPFGQKVLKHYWPNAISYEDITKTDFTIWRGRIDILTGGFPCQPYSAAGKRLGKEDERHLWPEMLRVIREVQPRWVVGENVLGLVNWNGGLVFEEVQADLEAEGYEVQPFILPAASVNAPHKRDRVWFVAFKDTQRNGRIQREPEQEGAEIREQRNACSGDSIGVCGEKVAGVTADTDSNRGTQFGESIKSEGEARNLKEQGEWIEHSKQPNELFGLQRNAPDTDSLRHTSCGEGTEAQGIGCGNNGEQKERSEQAEWSNGLLGLQRNAPDTNQERLQCKRGSAELGWKRLGFNNAQSNIPNWENFPTQPPICSGNDGLPTELDGITFSKWRNESIKAAGNAIVPQVVYQIFKAINEYREKYP
jgi:DNA (cytosine-5)-methyltransferase 1